MSLSCLQSWPDLGTQLTLHKASAGTGSEKYQSKFPWGTFWLICLTNWVDLKQYSNVLYFKLKVKDDWCLLLHQFKVEGEKSKNPVLIPRISYTLLDDPEETDSSKIILATGVNGTLVIMGNLIPAIVNGELAKRKSKATLANMPSQSNNIVVNMPLATLLVVSGVP
ncbi:hypothetical protein BS47DRAFT_1357468 [Hydnum rufescens UP504]|uniref:Uncharacterized protein n=1 Tax=Hydnum rufescens UP504 TaxID=1448309 RepID=A0A9P6E2P7_9AGAM|nr:hypothetical protein BS47DRAFT_1357468 [Hydnum rufescens UP504]